MEEIQTANEVIVEILSVRLLALDAASDRPWYG